MKDFNWNKFITDKIVVRCKNVEEVLDFSDKAKEHGLYLSKSIEKILIDNELLLSNVSFFCVNTKHYRNML